MQRWLKQVRMNVSIDIEFLIYSIAKIDCV
jgi:hypothetical protein